MARLLVCSLPTPTSSPTSKAMPRSKNSESTGIKKEKLITNPIKAPPAQKAKDAAKKAVKTSKKHGNKENNTSSGTTGQQHAKPSQQKSEGVNRQCEASPDVDALKARIKELEGAVMCKCGLHLGSPIQTSTDGIAGCSRRDNLGNE